MKEKAGATYHERFLILHKCIKNDQSKQSSPNCVEKIPTTRKCYYWSCKSQKFLTLKRSNLALSKEDEEDKDDENFNEATVNRKWKSRKVEITSNPVVLNGNCQITKRKLAVYLVAYFVSIYYFFPTYPFANESMK
ncbi:hypothetical protein LOAG_07967 [Loa loa]|uniref:Uncharacterized protein n=1 Tax=Loa loa TaxID=7209 RepID=A0A1S0TVF0_LOALO|nr:hypothetical protein LOAG_07967 [Loa loa]EFO20524.1 hypothetical protein LOAG_07967 [Loa loa]